MLEPKLLLEIVKNTTKLNLLGDWRNIRGSSRGYGKIKKKLERKRQPEAKKPIHHAPTQRGSRGVTFMLEISRGRTFAITLH